MKKNLFKIVTIMAGVIFFALALINFVAHMIYYPGLGVPSKISIVSGCIVPLVFGFLFFGYSGKNLNNFYGHGLLFMALSGVLQVLDSGKNPILYVLLLVFYFFTMWLSRGAHRRSS